MAFIERVRDEGDRADAPGTGPRAAGRGPRRGTMVPERFACKRSDERRQVRRAGIVRPRRRKCL